MSSAGESQSWIERTLADARRAVPDELSATDARRMLRRAMLAGSARARARTERRSWSALALGLAFSLSSVCAVTWNARHDSKPVQRVAALAPAHVVQAAVDAAQPTRLRLPSGDAMVATPGAQFELARADATERRVQLNSGTALFDVEPLHQGEAFVVVTPHARVRVHGTVFSVEVSRERTAVRVYQGVVSVNRASSESMSLRAGLSYASDGGALPAQELAPLLREARAMVARRAARTVPALPASLTPPAAPAPSPQATAAQVARSFVRTQSPSLQQARAWLQRGDAQRALDAARAAGGEHERGAWRLLEADALRSLGRHADAGAAYMVAARTSAGPPRAQAGYKAAVEYMFELADPRAALAALTAVAVDARGSSLRERGLLLRIEALQALGEPADALAREYLAEFPDSAGASELERLRGR
jgi:ferric-dicitrate binding protein FerR (iron transport regulator)